MEEEERLEEESRRKEGRERKRREVKEKKKRKLSFDAFRLTTRPKHSVTLANNKKINI